MFTRYTRTSVQVLSGRGWTKCVLSGSLLAGRHGQSRRACVMSLDGWHTAAAALQHLDVLTATERRGLQQSEMRLSQLAEEQMEHRLIAERLLVDLGKASCTELAGAQTSFQSLPASLRPHLRWLTRAILLLREPTLLGWILVYCAQHSGQGDQRLAESVAALFDPLSHEDEQRQRILILAMYELQLRRAEVSSPARVPPMLQRRSLAVRLLCEHLCRLPSARRYLQRALSGALESWFDLCVQRDQHRRYSDGPSLQRLHEGADSRAAGNSCEGHESIAAESRRRGEGLYAALSQLLVAATRLAPGIPMLLVCLCVNIAQWSNTQGIDARLAAGWLLTHCWISQALASPYTHGISVLSANEVQVQSARTRALGRSLRMLSGSMMDDAYMSDSDEDDQGDCHVDGSLQGDALQDSGLSSDEVSETARNSDDEPMCDESMQDSHGLEATACCERFESLSPSMVQTLEDLIVKLGAAALRSLDVARAGHNKPDHLGKHPNTSVAPHCKFEMPCWDETVPRTTALTPAQLYPLMMMLRGVHVHEIQDTHDSFCPGGSGADRRACGAALVFVPTRLFSMLHILLGAVDFSELLGNDTCKEVDVQRHGEMESTQHTCGPDMRDDAARNSENGDRDRCRESESRQGCDDDATAAVVPEVNTPPKHLVAIHANRLSKGPPTPGTPVNAWIAGAADDEGAPSAVSSVTITISDDLPEVAHTHNDRNDRKQVARPRRRAMTDKEASRLRALRRECDREGLNRSLHDLSDASADATAMAVLLAELDSIDDSSSASESSDAEHESQETIHHNIAVRAREEVDVATPPSALSMQTHEGSKRAGWSNEKPPSKKAALGSRRSDDTSAVSDLGNSRGVQAEWDARLMDAVEEADFKAWQVKQAHKSVEHIEKRLVHMLLDIVRLESNWQQQTATGDGDGLTRTNRKLRKLHAQRQYLEECAARGNAANRAHLKGAVSPHLASASSSIDAPVALTQRGILQTLAPDLLLKVPLCGEEDVDDEYARCASETVIELPCQSGQAQLGEPEAPSGLKCAPGAENPESTPEVDKGLVQVLCNLLRRLNPNGNVQNTSEGPQHDVSGSSGTSAGCLLRWLRSEHALALAMGAEGVAQQAQLDVVISMLASKSLQHEHDVTLACDAAASSIDASSFAASRIAYEDALLSAVWDEVNARRSALLTCAKRRDACAVAILELSAAQARAREHCANLLAQKNDLKLALFVGSRSQMRRALTQFQEAQLGSSAAAERVTSAARALEAISLHLSRDPGLPREQSIEALQKLLGRLAYAGARAACARHDLDHELQFACEQLRGPTCPPAMLNVPQGHERVFALFGLIARQLEAIREQRTVEVKAELVAEVWRVLLYGATGSGLPSHEAGFGLHADRGDGSASTAREVINCKSSDVGNHKGSLTEESLADLLPTAAWAIINCAPSSLLSDLQLVMEMLPPLLQTTPTAPLLLTAACMVRNLHPHDVNVAHLKSSNDADDGLVSGSTNSGSIDDSSINSDTVNSSTVTRQSFDSTIDAADVVAPQAPVLGSDGVLVIRQLREACARRVALGAALSSHINELSGRLRTAAAARHATQLHSHKLVLSLTRLYARSSAIRSSSPTIPPPTPPPFTAGLATPRIYDTFVNELRQDVRHLYEATRVADLALSYAYDPYPREVLHCLLHGVFGDLSQRTDQVQLRTLLGQYFEMQLENLGVPMAGGGIAAPPLAPGQPATSFLQPHCMIAEIAKGYFRLHPSIRHFLELSLTAPLNTILYETSFDLSLPSTALAQNGERPPEALIRALHATCELILTALTRDASIVPYDAQMLGETVWRAGLRRGLTESSALALVAQLFVGCWLAPAVAAPQAYNIFPEPSPHMRTCSNLDAVARELMRLPAALYAGERNASVELLSDWIQSVLLNASTAREQDTRRGLAIRSPACPSPRGHSRHQSTVVNASASIGAWEACPAEPRSPESEWERKRDEEAIAGAMRTHPVKDRSRDQSSESDQELCVMSAATFSWLHQFVERSHKASMRSSAPASIFGDVERGHGAATHMGTLSMAAILRALRPQVQEWCAQHSFSCPTGSESNTSARAEISGDGTSIYNNFYSRSGGGSALGQRSTASSVANQGDWSSWQVTDLLVLDVSQATPTALSLTPVESHATNTTSAETSAVHSQDTFCNHMGAVPHRKLVQLCERCIEVVYTGLHGHGNSADNLAPLAIEWMPVSSESLSGWLRRLADHAEASGWPLEASRLLLLAFDLEYEEGKALHGSLAPQGVEAGLEGGGSPTYSQTPEQSSGSAKRTTDQPLQVTQEVVKLMADRTANIREELRRQRKACAVSSRVLAQLQRKADEKRRLCELQSDAAAALLLQQHLPDLAPRLTPLFHDFQSKHPQLPPGQCKCFAPYHHTCGDCTKRRDALDAMLHTLDSSLASPLQSPAPNAARRIRRSFGNGVMSPLAISGTAASGPPHASNSDGSTDSTLEQLRTHLREIITRQLYHSLYACSAYDDPVASHLRSLHALTPAHLGVSSALALPSLWTAAVDQLSSLDRCATPGAGLRCILRAWDALLGVLGVWAKHAQADDFMPLMAYVIIQAAPSRLISQLHFVRNYLGTMTSRQEMWMAHFTAACEVACRLTPAIAATGLAISTDQSVWKSELEGPVHPPDEQKDSGERRVGPHTSRAALSKPSPSVLSTMRQSRRPTESTTPLPPLVAEAEHVAASAMPSPSTSEGGRDGSQREIAIEQAITLMREMGFDDEQLNRDVLAACAYDTERAVSLLCGEEPAIRA